jgi:cytochrome P450
MAPYYPAVQAAAEHRLTEWAALADGALVNVAHEMMRTTFDAILDAMLTVRHSMDANRVERAITDYLSSTGWVILLALLGLPAWLPYPGRIRSEIACRFLKRAAWQAVKHSQNSPDPSNLVACLAKASDPTTHRVMNEVDLTDNFITFMAAGHETTALALTWTWYLLALHPEVEERVTTEVQQCISGNGLSYIDLERLTYTRQVIEESMRLYPPAPLIVRRAITDVRVGDCLVRSGNAIYIPVYAIHRHEKLWSEPDKFDPDRFASDVASTRSRYAYLPFGAGPRICIGRSFAMMEAVTMLALLINSYRLSLPSDYQPQMESQVRRKHACMYLAQKGAFRSVGPCSRLAGAAATAGQHHDQRKSAAASSCSPPFSIAFRRKLQATLCVRLKGRCDVGAWPITMTPMLGSFASGGAHGWVTG